MSDEKEVKLVVPKSLMVVLWIAAIGLVLNGLQPLLSAQANANSYQVHKIAICNPSGELCAGIDYMDFYKTGALITNNYGR